MNPLVKNTGQGTAFPAPRTNRRFFRTDLGLDFYHNGTYWLTVQQYTQSFVPIGSATRPYTLNSAADPTAILDTSLGLVWIDKIVTVTYVGTNLDAAKYWTIQYRVQNAAGSATNIGAAISLSTASGGVIATNQSWTTTIGAAYSGQLLIAPQLTKVTTPGDLYITPTVLYRLVGT